MKRSWQATWTIIVVYGIFLLLFFLIGKGKILAPFERELDVSTHTMTLLAIGIWAVCLVYLIVDTVLSRFGWEWFVRMGMRMVGGQQYASLSPEEKRERGRLMQLIHPYTYSVSIIAGILGGIVSLLTMATPQLPGTGMEVQPDLGQAVLQMLGSSIAGLLSLGALALMIVQRVFAVQKVYGVSGARAFWGPFIPYGIMIFLLVAITIVVIIAVIAAAMGAIDGMSHM